jgi:predicted transcriptional regulator
MPTRSALHVTIRLIWARTEPVTVKDIFRVLASRREIAYTTVITTMSRLAEKGILHCEPIQDHRDAAYRYTAVLRHQEVLLARVEQVLAGADEVERSMWLRRFAA